MTDLEYKEFAKRYEKFKNCNLPVRYWDEERQTLEYVYFENKEESEEWRNYNISDSLFYSLSNIAFTGLYYSFNCGGYIEENGEWVKKVEHNHAHSFEEVVQCLYDYP